MNREEVQNQPAQGTAKLSERAAFETYVVNKLNPMARGYPALARDRHGDYTQHEIQACWEAWQARSAAPTPGKVPARWLEAAPQPANFDDMPLAIYALSIEEKARWINVLDPLLKYAGRPGDWGHDSKLGLLTMRLLQVRQQLVQEPKE